MKGRKKLFYFVVILSVSISLGFILNPELDDIIIEKYEKVENWLMPDSIHELLAVIAEIFPELEDKKIEVKNSSIKTTMNVRPTFFSLFFNKKESRKYVLRINTSERKGNIFYKDVPTDAKIGLLAHEMMHIVDFSERNFWGVLKRGVQYLSLKGKIKYESEIDQMVIDGGLGDYLHSWSDYVLNHSFATEKYKLFKRTVYLTPCEIEERMQFVVLD